MLLRRIAWSRNPSPKRMRIPKSRFQVRKLRLVRNRWSFRRPIRWRLVRRILVRSVHHLSPRSSSQSSSSSRALWIILRRLVSKSSIKRLFRSPLLISSRCGKRCTKWNSNSILNWTPSKRGLQKSNPSLQPSRTPWKNTHPTSTATPWKSTSPKYSKKNRICRSRRLTIQVYRNPI